MNIKQKQWLCSNFRLRIGKLPCTRVSKVDSFTIKQGIKENTVDAVRAAPPGATPSNSESKITFSALMVGPWQDWFKTS